MSNRTDIFSNGPQQPDRLNYATGMLLASDDFQAEQAYHRGRLNRVLAYLHGWGTVAGLEVTYEEALAPGVNPDFPDGREERLFVQPGLAIDRLGRLIEVHTLLCLRLGMWYEQQDVDQLNQALQDSNNGGNFDGVLVDLFIRFVICERGKTPAFAAGPYDAVDSVVVSRLRDGVEVELILRTDQNPQLPVDSWEQVRAENNAAVRTEMLHKVLLSSWREATQWDESRNALKPLPEHKAGQNTTDLFLVRLELPATADGDNRPQRSAGAIVPDNSKRLFVYTPNALAARMRI